jgi:hypothetical protein
MVELMLMEISGESGSRSLPAIAFAMAEEYQSVESGEPLKLWKKLTGEAEAKIPEVPSGTKLATTLMGTEEGQLSDQISIAA